MVDVRCPNCGTSFMVGDENNCVKHISSDGLAYLVPTKIRNENLVNDEGVNTMNEKMVARMNALKDAGINIDKLRTLMGSNSSFEDIFDPNDPILNEIKGSGFINNPELFRRWICAQSWRLIKDKRGWTRAVRETYTTSYVLRQMKEEMRVLIKLSRKHRCNDKRFQFFRLEVLKDSYIWFAEKNWACSDKAELERQIKDCHSIEELFDVVASVRWGIDKRKTKLPSSWLNAFKGAGAYYTLQNLIRTHGLVLPTCEDMNDSLEVVEGLFNNITQYQPLCRRWDLMMSLLIASVEKTGFELKY